jgi:hypothetical protein
VNYEDLWRELEAGRVDGEGRLVRRIHPESAVDLYLGVTKPDNRRILSMGVAAGVTEELDDLPSGRGIETRVRHSPDEARAQLQLVLGDPMSADIFTALAQDLAAAVSPVATDKEAVATWVGRLRRWQGLLAALTHDGLSGERQRGLYAELWMLRRHLFGSLGADSAIRGWTGPSASSHDFELDYGAVEVKSTAGKQHQRLRIASERQLDDTGVPQLFLYHLSLDVRQGEGETLIDAVNAVRAELAGTLVAVEFEERLLMSGYTAAHEPRYRGTVYTEREENFFRVEAGFPRLIESDLPSGIGDVRYSVAVAECKHWGVSAGEAMNGLAEAPR